MFIFINIIAIATIIITLITLSKYKLVSLVTINGEKVGYVESKEKFEQEIDNYISDLKKTNIAFVDIENTPKYGLRLINKNENTNENTILSKMEEDMKITYRLYAITLDGEEKSKVNTLEEAETLVADLKEEYNTLELNIGIKELYTEDMQECESSTVKTARNSMTQELDIIESKSINGVYLACVPVSGVITSRFGAVESIRDHTHMGIDIGANYGTSIKAVADGTITCAEEWGGYGNLVVIDHGNGVESYYGHCSKLYVSEGQKVIAGDVIAAVGSTGNSTGNHLHFELRNNGVQANPEKYVYKGQ
ncbi:MAG: peptidoglycan DD-metalloendopeptidase family protein [Clostridia bacterium]|nr:peptidoglycan DD-metalloendopeptidase family protein [Clostridia bacterium]